MPPYLKIINLDSVDSTNNYCHTLALAGAREITVVRAAEQTHGRGRFDRLWQSPLNKGLYVSFLLRPGSMVKNIQIFPLLAAAAVVKMLMNYLPQEKSAAIKIPNDVIVNDKKICGCLVEAKTTGMVVDFLVAGIGININGEFSDLPPEATSLYQETNKKFDLDKLFVDLVNEFITMYGLFKDGAGQYELGKIKFYKPELYGDLTNKILKDIIAILR